MEDEHSAVDFNTQIELVLGRACELLDDTEQDWLSMEMNALRGDTVQGFANRLGWLLANVHSDSGAPQGLDLQEFILEGLPDFSSR
jgi:hypothetical protein